MTRAFAIAALALVACAEPELDPVDWPASCDIHHHTYDYSEMLTATGELGLLDGSGFLSITAGTPVEESVDPWGDYSQWIVFFAMRVTVPDVSTPTVCGNIGSELAPEDGTEPDGVVMTRDGSGDYVSPLMPFLVERATKSNNMAAPGTAATFSSDLTVLGTHGDYSAVGVAASVVIVNDHGFLSN